MAYRVVAPYVTLKVRDNAGALVVSGFYAGATVPDSVDGDSLQHHLDTGLVVEDGTPEAELAAPAGTPMPGEPPNVEVTEQPVGALGFDERLRRQREAADEAAASRSGRPSQRAPKDEWVAYAVAQRDADVSEEDARAQAEGMSKNDLMARYAG